MKLRYFLASAFFAVASLLTGQTAYAGACEGKFMNPITDICWSCMYPIRLFGSLNLGSGAAEDYDSGFDKAVCLATRRRVSAFPRRSGNPFT